MVDEASANPDAVANVVGGEVKVSKNALKKQVKTDSNIKEYVHIGHTNTQKTARFLLGAYRTNLFTSYTASTSQTTLATCEQFYGVCVLVQGKLKTARA